MRRSASCLRAFKTYLEKEKNVGRQYDFSSLGPYCDPSCSCSAEVVNGMSVTARETRRISETNQLNV